MQRASLKNPTLAIARAPQLFSRMVAALLLVVLLWTLFLSPPVHALDPQANSANNGWTNNSARAGQGPLTQIRGVPDQNRWVNDGGKRFRSKSEVVNEVKRRYNASVLKITLVEQRAIYRVRILMPNGKVRNITVSARR